MKYNKNFFSLQILVPWIFLGNIYEFHAQIPKITTSGVNGLSWWIITIVIVMCGGGNNNKPTTILKGKCVEEF